MADSDTTQQVPDTVANAARQAREAHKKLLAETQAIIANAQLKRAETPSAEPAKNVLTKTQRLRIITKALSDLYSALPRVPFHAVAKAIAKNVDFSCDGYPIDEVDNSEQSSAITRQLLN